MKSLFPIFTDCEKMWLKMVAISWLIISISKPQDLDGLLIGVLVWVVGMIMSLGILRNAEDREKNRKRRLL